MNYYSDNQVDRFIEPFLPKMGNAVDVGANNGVFLSNSLHFEEQGWRVLCVEPNPALAEEGRRNRRIWRQVACGPEDKPQVDFSVVGNYPYASYSSTQLKNEHSPKILTSDEWAGIQAVTRVVQVPMLTLDTLLEQEEFESLDMLTIDVEGHELDVLRGISLDKWNPKVIVAEAWGDKFERDLIAHLHPFGYSMKQKLGLDLIFVLQKP